MSRNKGNIPLLLLVLVAIVFMAIGIFVYQQQLDSGRNLSNSGETINPQVETFVNQQLGFSIDYPKIMKMSGGDGWVEANGERYYHLSFLGNDENSPTQPRYHISIIVNPNVDKNIWESIKKDGQAAILAGQSAIKKETTEPGENGKPSLRYVNYFLMRDGNLYTLEAATGDNNIIPLKNLEDSLRSFDFLAGPDSLPSGWEKTVVQSGLFSIAAPADWDSKRSSNSLEFSSGESRAKITWGNNLKDPSAPGPGITERLYTNAGNFDLCQKLGDNLVFYTNCDVFKQWDRDNSSKLRKQYNFEADVKFKDNEIVDETPLDILRTFSFL